MKSAIKRIQEPFTKFFEMEAAGGIAIISAVIVAMIFANSPLSAWFLNLWQEHLLIETSFLTLDLTYQLWINDGLMAIFFFLIGLEIRREMMVGELVSIKRSAGPILAAIGGMIIPAVLFLFIIQDSTEVHGWGIVMATDIAIALGVLKLLGNKVSNGVKVFLVALAIIDDIGAILVIAFFYSSDVNIQYLYYAFPILFLLWAMMKLKAFNTIIFIIGAIIVWILFYKAHIHPTIAGVLLAFCVPNYSHINIKEYLKEIKKNIHDYNEVINPSPILNERQYEEIYAISVLTNDVQPKMQSWEHKLHAFVVFFILPLFALANGGVVLFDNGVFNFSHLSMTIAISLVIGKAVGIFGFFYIAYQFNLVKLPDHTTLKQIFGVGLLGGIGFTMSIFISNLAFDVNDIQNQSKLGILCGSLIAGILGYVFLKYNSKEK